MRADIVAHAVVGNQQLDAEPVLDQLPAEIRIEPGQNPAGGLGGTAGRHRHLWDQRRRGQQSVLGGDRELGAEIEILGATHRGGRSDGGTPFAEKVLSRPQLEPVGQQADSQQRLWIGLGDRAVLSAEGVAGLENDAADADRGGRLRQVRSVGIEMRRLTAMVRGDGRSSEHQVEQRRGVRRRGLACRRALRHDAVAPRHPDHRGSGQRRYSRSTHSHAPDCRPRSSGRRLRGPGFYSRPAASRGTGLPRRRAAADDYRRVRPFTALARARK